MIQLYSEEHEDTDLAISCRPGVKGNETLEALFRKKDELAGSQCWIKSLATQGVTHFSFAIVYIDMIENLHLHVDSVNFSSQHVLF